MTKSSRPNSSRAGARARERAIASCLSARALVRDISYFSTIDSTNKFALALAGGDELHGRLIVADRQTAGRGRFGREWHNQSGKDLLFSLILCPPPPQAFWPLLTLALGVSICQALSERFGLSAELRWPNDVLIGERKVGGILTEVSALTPDRLVIGAGLNVNGSAAALPDELRESATTLKAELGRSLRRGPLLEAILANFEQQYDVFCRHDTERLAESCRRWQGTLGKVVQVELGEQSFAGVAVELTESGGLVVRRESGQTQTLHSGDVIEIKPKP